ncbi:hypothetical protein BDA99DRAFT_543645 [Phascolomyces articulosus]|uniref:Uncharacterized protein n=1 Tax=Phascolomyces articulosus TaxID=60185 RepID=A0AAD5JWQ2_9FUNG|nr:hypothetical protein BDA99DRAFT_543645 [Phascolomyces articulosus]
MLVLMHDIWKCTYINVSLWNWLLGSHIFRNNDLILFLLQKDRYTLPEDYQYSKALKHDPISESLNNHIYYMDYGKPSRGSTIFIIVPQGKAEGTIPGVDPVAKRKMRYCVDVWYTTSDVEFGNIGIDKGIDQTEDMDLPKGYVTKFFVIKVSNITSLKELSAITKTGYFRIITMETTRRAVDSFTMELQSSRTKSG